MNRNRPDWCVILTTIEACAAICDKIIKKLRNSADTASTTRAWERSLDMAFAVADCAEQIRALANAPDTATDDDADTDALMGKLGGAGMKPRDKHSVDFPVRGHGLRVTWCIGKGVHVALVWCGVAKWWRNYAR